VLLQLLQVLLRVLLRVLLLRVPQAELAGSGYDEAWC
jgi:hypothetical protein